MPHREDPERGDEGPDLLTIPSVPASVAAARRFALHACRAAGLLELCDTAVLLVSEVATNALVHGSGQVLVRVVPTEGGVRVEVVDGSPSLPRPREATPMDEGGRGLALVEALSSSWGAERSNGGKTVWFEVADE